MIQRANTKSKTVRDSGKEDPSRRLVITLRIRLALVIGGAVLFLLWIGMDKVRAMSHRREFKEAVLHKQIDQAKQLAGELGPRYATADGLGALNEYSEAKKRFQDQTGINRELIEKFGGAEWVAAQDLVKKAESPGDPREGAKLYEQAWKKVLVIQSRLYDVISARQAYEKISSGTTPAIIARIQKYASQEWSTAQQTMKNAEVATTPEAAVAAYRQAATFLSVAVEKSSAPAKAFKTDNWIWEATDQSLSVSFLEAADARIVFTLSSSGRGVVSKVIITTQSPTSGYKWYGRWDDTSGGNWGYIRLNEEFVDGKWRLVGDTTDGRRSDNFIHPAVIRPTRGSNFADKPGVRALTEALRPNWKGVCTQSGYAPYPMLLQIDTQSGNDISGVIRWPSLGDSITRFRGKVQNSRITFTEYELIQGRGAAVPTEYEASIKDDIIEGTCRTKMMFRTVTAAFRLEPQTGNLSIDVPDQTQAKPSGSSSGWQPAQSSWDSQNKPVAQPNNSGWKPPPSSWNSQNAPVAQPNKPSNRSNGRTAW